MPAPKRAIVREVVEAREMSPLELQFERAAAEREGDEPLPEPVTYYNPYSPNERFRIPGTSHWTRFAAGRYDCKTVKEEELVRRILAAWGRDKPDRWKGDDKKTPWMCKNCGFLSLNENAVDDHRERGF